MKEAGCSLVFFSDPRIKISEEKTLALLNERYSSYINLYDRIDDRQTLQQISDAFNDLNPKATYREMGVVVSTYGEIRYSIKEECDLELAQYACRHNAMAVISNDSDFLIYDGAWQLWWSGGCTMDTMDVMDSWNELKTTEYIRLGLANICLVRPTEMPLFATLLGGDFTKRYLNCFYGKQRIEKIADYVRKVGKAPFSDSDIKRIAQCVFKDAVEPADEIQRSIRKSLEWFDINFPPPTLDDKLAESFLNISLNGNDINMFRPYMKYMSSIHAITTQFYDMRECEKRTNLPLLMMDWKRRNVGVLRQRFHGDDFQLTILAKTDNYKNSNLKHTEKPIYPDCMLEIRPMLQIYQIRDERSELCHTGSLGHTQKKKTKTLYSYSIVCVMLADIILYYM